MSRFSSITPNLVVQDVERSTAFYRDVLGFQVTQTVPDQAPFVFVMLDRDGVQVFLNAVQAAVEDFPDAATWPSGGTNTMFFVVTDVDGLHAQVVPHTAVVMPLKTQFYGMREFAVRDPDGHLITFAERVSP